ncbi:MAG: hypothetical protein AAGF31_09615 [Planctomycetota bacterium]
MSHASPDRRRTFWRRTSVGAVTIAIATFALGALISTLHPPVPEVHDEFSYLLAGETFAAGRLTNPTHPCWKSFESYHVFHQPSYASKYPPGQGLFLAAGILLFGQPIAGVWLAQAAAAAACYWMLRGRGSPKGAMLGSLVLLLQPSIQLTWGQTYWGGSVAMLGGALLIGATIRLIKQPAATPAVAMALGALVLANSRPYEGAVACLVCVLWTLLGWWRRGWPDWRAVAKRVVLPQMSVMSIGLAAMAFYNWQVTGDPLTLPYMVHEEQYALSPNFIWQEPVEGRTYRHQAMQDFHEKWALPWHTSQQTLAGYFDSKLKATLLALWFYFPIPLAVVFVATPWMRGKQCRVLAAACLLGWAASMASVWSWPHYLAPLVAPASLALLVWGLRNIAVMGRHRGVGRWVVTALLLLQATVFTCSVASHVQNEDVHWHHLRASFEQSLQTQPGKDVIFVRYTKPYYSTAEWVYNAADIEQAEVVWARETGDECDQRLLDHFSDRQFWLLLPDERPMQFVPYALRNSALASHAADRSP